MCRVNLFMVEDVIKKIDLQISYINKYKNMLINSDNSQLIFPIFIYIYSLFESILSEVLVDVVSSFPEKVKEKKDFTDLFSMSINNDYINYKIMDTNAIKYVRRISSKPLGSFIIKIEKIIEYKFKYDSDIINEIAETRNIIVHKNNIGSFEKWKHGNTDISNIELEMINIYLEKILEFLDEFKGGISYKFHKYNRKNLIIESWNYIFKDCVLIKDCIYFDRTNHVRFDFESIKHYIYNYSSSEQTLIELWLKNYSDYISEILIEKKIKTKSINYLASTKAIFIIMLFDKYPKLLEY